MLSSVQIILLIDLAEYVVQEAKIGDLLPLHFAVCPGATIYFLINGILFIDGELRLILNF